MQSSYDRRARPQHLSPQKTFVLPGIEMSTYNSWIVEHFIEEAQERW